MGIIDRAGHEQAPPKSAAHDIPIPVRAAAVVIGLESVALVAAAGVLVAKTVAGTPQNVGRSLLAAVLALSGAAVLFFGARGLRRLSSAARAPIVVLQLLALPVAYSLLQAGQLGYGVPIAIAALAALVLLFVPPARDALDRDL